MLNINVIQRSGVAFAAVVFETPKFDEAFSLEILIDTEFVYYCQTLDIHSEWSGNFDVYFSAELIRTFATKTQR